MQISSPYWKQILKRTLTKSKKFEGAGFAFKRGEKKISQTGISEVAKVNSLCISLLEYLYLLMGKKYISLENSVERLSVQ